MRIRFAPFLVLALVAAGCATPPARVPLADLGCEARLARVDAAVEKAEVGDAQAARIEGFPYLRVNRFLASFRDEVKEPAAVAAWIDRLARLDAEARTVELANLPPAERRALGQDDPAALAETLDRCRATLAARDAADPARLARLRQAAVVPDAYSAALRALGLYPLTRIAFSNGVDEFEAQTRAVFDTPLDALPVLGTLTRWTPPDGPPWPDAGAVLAASADNPLGIPEPDPEALARLVRAHAPVFEVDVADRSDRIGNPTWPPHGPVGIDAVTPRVFWRTAHTRFGDRVLLQLVYTAWFPERPAREAGDILAGRLDGLVWRVTLAPDGEPLVFDTIHPCGCYHFFIPTARALPRPAPDSDEEWRFMPQRLPRQGPGERVVLRVASATHYLQRVRYEPRAAADGPAYALVPADTLRSLPRADGGRRSMFGPDGLVAGSERGERFLFWPMGIPSAGAMRQWGHHATAFVGRRHFDDVRLMDERFVMRPSSGTAAEGDVLGH